MNLGRYYIDDRDYPHGSTDPNRINRLRRFMNFAVKKSQCVEPKGALYIKCHSRLPSDAYQTQILRSCYNYLMIKTSLVLLG